jgi:hypothetical protein
VHGDLSPTSGLAAEPAIADLGAGAPAVGRRKVVDPEPSRSRPGSGWRVLAPPALAWLALALGLFVLLYFASRNSFGGNSDGATVVLEGQSIRAGHLGLGGWNLSLDSFWTIDALFYAGAVAIVGVRHELLHAVPALIAVAVILVGGVMARVGRRGVAGLAALAVVVVLLALPSPDLAFFLLQGPWHIGTLLWCLGAFAALSRNRFDWSFVLAVALLAAGLLGDLQTVLVGVAPAVFGGLCAMARCRSVRRGLVAASAGIAALVVAGAARELAVRVGTFSIATSHDSAKWQQVPSNLGHIVTWSAAMLGVGAIPIGPSNALSAPDITNGSIGLRVLHVVGLILVLAGVGYALAGLIRGVVRGVNRPTSPGRSDVEWRLEDLLVLGLGADLALFVESCPNNNGDYARYLTAAVIIGVILAGRLVGRGVAQLPHRNALVALGAMLALGVGFGVGVGQELGATPAPQPAIALGKFLAAHQLDNGVGDYWSSSIVTVETSGAVAVRPVIPDTTGVLVRYGRQSDAHWYLGQKFEFLVYDTARPWRKVNEVSATASFGSPTHVYAVGTYRVLTWSHPISVSPVGYSRS